jgi:hypothetical protein
MATNQQGIAITIKAWLPTGKTLDEQLASLTLVKTAHASGDYAPLLGAAKIEAVQTDSKTRRIDEPSAGQKIIEGMTEALEYARAQPGLTPEQLERAGLKPYNSADYTTGLADPADANTSTATPADQDDAQAERPALDEPDGTVTEPAAQEEDHPMTKALRSKKAAA